VRAERTRARAVAMHRSSVECPPCASFAAVSAEPGDIVTEEVAIFRNDSDQS